MNDIDWELVSGTISFYKTIDYSYIEVPWFCQSEALNTTLPPGKHGMMAWHPTITPGYLVGSAEQSFIQMMLDDKLNKGKYCAATPCFRDDTIDELHSLSFFKVELIEINPKDKNIDSILTDAKINMEGILYRNFLPLTISIKETAAGKDLYYNDIEVGSYGYREYKGYSWIYGTGLALPRFSQAMSKFKE